METATLNWVLVTITLYVALFILVPPKKVSKLFPFGFYLGFVQAVVILFLGQSYFQLFQLVGDPVLFGIPLLAPISWIAPTIFFAYFFPLMDTPLKRIGYVLLFATGAVFVEYSASLIGLWKNIRWNLVYTFLLAVFAHSLMTAVLLYQQRKHKIK